MSRPASIVYWARRATRAGFSRSCRFLEGPAWRRESRRPRFEDRRGGRANGRWPRAPAFAGGYATASQLMEGGEFGGADFGACGAFNGVKMNATMRPAGIVAIPAE